jgi:hypothetical protein
MNRKLTQLDLERRRVAKGVVQDTIPADIAREEQERIAREMTEATRALEGADKGFMA